jgi:flagellar biosynthetic protein FliO
MTPEKWRNLIKRLFERFPVLNRVPSWVWWSLAVVLLTLIFILGNSTLPTPGGANEISPLETFTMTINILLKLAVVVALIYGCAYLLRRWRGILPSKVDKQLTIIETTHLSPRQALHLMQVGDRVVLIGATDQSITLLTEVELLKDESATTALADVSGSSQSSFSDLIQSMK